MHIFEKILPSILRFRVLFRGGLCDVVVVAAGDRTILTMLAEIQGARWEGDTAGYAKTQTITRKVRG